MRRRIKTLAKWPKLAFRNMVAWLPWIKTPKVKFGAIGIILLFLAAEIFGFIQPYLVPHAYALGQSASLLSPINQMMAQKLHYNSKQKLYQFNPGYSPDQGNLLGPGSQVSASAGLDPSQGVTVNDPTHKVSFTITPEFGLWQGKQNGNRIVYPLTNGNKGWVVYTMHSIGVKEDVLLTSSDSDSATFDYKLGLGDSLSARLERDGSIGIYGNSLLSGNVATGSKNDASLLNKARQNAPKNTLLFSLPPPTVKGLGKTPTKVKASYQLSGSDLKVNVSGLSAAHYPLTIDPSVYVTSAQQFMNGNNETNIDFDVADSLIEKGKTTGARFNSWQATKNLNNEIWQQGVVAAGGFIYTVGGNYPNGSSETFSTVGSSTYTVPSGTSTITVKAWGGGGGGGGGGDGSGSTGGNGGGAGFTQTTLVVTPNENLNVTVGGGGGAGQNNNNNSGAGGGGGGYSGVSRSSTPLVIAAGGAGGGGAGRSSYVGGDGGAGGGTIGVDGSDGSNAPAGSGGTQSSGGNGSSGGNNDGTNGGALVGGDGADGRNRNGSSGSASNGGTAGGGNGGSADVNHYYAGGGGGGGGYYGGGGGGDSTNWGRSAGGGGGGSSYTSGSSSTSTAGSGETPGNSGDVDRSGAGQGGDGGARRADGTGGTSGLVIIMAGSGATNTASISWAQFSPTDGTIQSANPGSGTCAGWCTTSLYDLPAPRSNLSLVAYNGFLYAIGGTDSSCTSANGTGDNGICNTVYIAKLGANGEPRLWNPTSTNQSNWVYWYRDNNLTSPRSLSGAVAYENHLYLLGGETSSGGTASVTNSAQVADISPTGSLGSWSSETNLPYNLYGHGIQIYNGVIYIIGGTSSIGGVPLSSVYYNKINDDGSLNSWVQTSSLTGGRATEGGNFTAVWGGYIYLSGGCSAVNSSGYCTALAGDTQLASINADGSLDTWTTNQAVNDSRIGHNVVAWQDYIYEIGGCTTQNGVTGNCTSALNTINYGKINQDGDASTVNESVASGTSPCSGSNPYSCNLPPPGSGAGQGGQMLSATAIMKGYLYVIGGCSNESCSNTSENTSYAAIGSDGQLDKPAACGGTYYGSWCVDSTNNINGGVAAAGTVVFNGRIYVVGGLDGNNNTNDIYYNSVNDDGSLAGAWTAQSLTGLGADSVSYDFAYARANPSAAGAYPGNLYIFGGCANSNEAGCTAYNGAVYKCNLATTGAVSACSTTGQLQIGTITGDTQPGLGMMSGTVYANYIYLIGGVSPNQTDLKTIRYAKFDDNNNVVAVSGTDWIQSPVETEVGRRRGAAFGYNGYIYVVGGYDGTDGGGILADIEFAKVNVSDGSLVDQNGNNLFNVSSVTIGQRWGLSVPISNSYAYVIGGCDDGNSPNCNNGGLQPVVQTFQIYNNDSGSPAGYSTSASTFGTDPNRLGVSATVLNGYIYAAGGCTTVGCSAVSQTVSYAPIDANGTVGTWSATGSLPSGRGWGKLEAAGGSLYYLGGQDSSSAAQGQVYYATPAANGSISAWSTSSHGLPHALSDFSSTVWNNRMYVTGNYEAGQTSINHSWSTGDINTRVTSVSGVFDGAHTGHSNYVLAPIQSGVAAYTPTGALDWSFNGIVQGYDVRDIAVGDLEGTGYNDTAVICSGYYAHTGDYVAILDRDGNVIQLIATPANDQQCTNVIIVGTDIYIGSTYGLTKYVKSGTTWTVGWQQAITGVRDMIIGDAGNGTRLFITSNKLYEYQLNGTLDWSATIPANNYNGNIAIGKTDPSIAGKQIVIASQGTTVIYDKDGNSVGSLPTGTNVRTGITLYDENGDGIDEIYLTDMGQDIYAWQNTGPSTYAVKYSMLNYLPSGTYAGLSNSDLTGKGTDIIAAGTNGIIYIIKPDLSAVAATINVGHGAIGYRYNGGLSIKSNIQLSDIDGDGNPDLVVPSNNGYVDVFAAEQGLASNMFVSPQQNSGGDISGVWSTSSASVNFPRGGATMIAYANNLYLLGGKDADGNYLSDVQYAQINSNNGNVGSWSFTTSLPYPISGGDGFAVNGYMYLIGGRSADNTCSPSTLVAPISANTTIASGNHPTGIGEWYETDQSYSGSRYGNAAVYNDGKAYVIGGACSSAFASPVIQQSTLLSQPQVAHYSILIDADSDVYPEKWLMNGLDNSIGAEWQLKYKSMPNTTTLCTSPAMTGWGQTTDFGNVTLGQPEVYTPLDASGNNTNCARFFYLSISIDSSHAYGYPEDVSRGPTITDLTLEFTADPAKRLMHGRTFTGGIQQPDATPF